MWITSPIRRCVVRLLFAVLLMPSAAWAQTVAEWFHIEPPPIEAESYILLDADTGEVLVEKNADLRLPPASLTKIMTSYMAFAALQSDAVQLAHKIPISRKAWSRNVQGSKMFLRVDTEVSVQDLLFGLIVQSGNDAAIALAEGLSGSEQEFADEMNLILQKWDVGNTHFVNATGLPSEQHYSSARDIATISRRLILDFPQYYLIYRKREYTYNAIRQENRNPLLGAFGGADGIKTGYTRAAGYCMAASAVRGERRLIAVVMRTLSERKRRNETTKLLQFGFDKFQNYPLFDDEKARKIPIYQGDRDFVLAKPMAKGVIVAPRGMQAKTHFVVANPPRAPFAVGASLGTIHISLNDGPYREVSVNALAAVGEADFSDKVLDYIKWEYLGHGHELKLLSKW